MEQSTKQDEGLAQDLPAELSALEAGLRLLAECAAAVDDEALKDAAVAAEDFQDPTVGRAVEAVLAMRSRGEPVTPSDTPRLLAQRGIESPVEDLDRWSGGEESPAELAQLVRSHAREKTERMLNAEGLTDGQEVRLPPTGPALTFTRFVNGADFIYDTPSEPEAVWGSGSEVLWARDEALMVVGDSGLGKTTLLGLLVRGLLGLDDEVLGMPVVPAEGRVLYLAMDRPAQTARRLRTQFFASEQARVSAKLEVWKGPPPQDLATDPTVLLQMAQAADATHVFVDSLKDAVLKLSDDAMAGSYNRARQLAGAEGVQVCESHHNRKEGPTTKRTITSLADVYGSVWLAGGAGSVIGLNGEQGGSTLELRHLKQPSGDVGPLEISIDRAAGTMTTAVSTDVLGCVAEAWRTTAEVAVLQTGNAKPSKAAVQKVKRQLDQLAKAGLIEVGSPVKAPNHSTVERYRTGIVSDGTVTARSLFGDLS